MIFGEPFGGLLPGARGATLSVLLRTDSPMTGRQVHHMVSDSFSLWSVQEALKALNGLGLVQTQSIGRAGVHTINDDHVAAAHLRALADPVGMLKGVIGSAVDSHVEAVVLFGSVARDDATASSDIDLAVIASTHWEGRTDLEDAVLTKLGNACEVLVFTEAEFSEMATSGEPVVSDIIRDGIALVGTLPRIKSVA